MNKTIDINLAGILFHLDETAYRKLRKYLNAVRSSLQHQEDVDEVMNEIEARIAELLGEKQVHPQQVINDKNIDEIIAVLGEPEDYEDVVEEPVSAKNYRIKKGLFRDMDKSVFGGVAAGFAHYLGMDITLMRIVFVLILFFSHSSFGLIYLLLWIVIPKAKTASDKLRMKGEKVNLDSIVDQVSTDEPINKKKNNLGTKLENSTQEFGQVFARIIGLLIAFITGSILLVLIVSVLSLSSMSDMHIFVVNTPFYEGLNMPFGWLNSIAFVLVGFPVALLFLLGVKMLFPNAKSIGKNIFVIGGTIWFLTLVFAIVKSTSLLAHKNESAKIISEQKELSYKTDTLFLSMDKHLLMAKNNFNSNKRIHFYFKASTDDAFHLQVEKESEGIDVPEAKLKAENILYKYQIDSLQPKLVFSNKLLYPNRDFVQEHEVFVNVFVPNNKYIKMTDGVSNHTYKFYCQGDNLLKNVNGKIICEDNANTDEDWQSDENQENEVIRINGKNVNIKITDDGLDLYTDDDSNKRTHIKIDENGIQINAQKTKRSDSVKLLNQKTNNQ